MAEQPEGQHPFNLDSIPAARPLPRPHKSGRLRWVLFGFLAFAGLAALCVGVFVWFILGGKAEAEPVAEAFLAAIERGAYSEAYDSLGPEL